MVSSLLQSKSQMGQDQVLLKMVYGAKQSLNFYVTARKPGVPEVTRRKEIRLIV